MKVACTHFQCAAWAFHTMPDRYPVQTGSDMCADLCAFISQVGRKKDYYDLVLMRFRSEPAVSVS
jgi:hypothetical protein